MNSGKVIISLLAGIAAGSIIGILFAPDKGTDTRKKISKKRDDYMDDIKSKLDDLICSINDRFESSKEDVDDLIEKGKSKAQQIKRKISY